MELARELDVPEWDEDNPQLYESVKSFAAKAEELLVLEAEAIRKCERITFSKSSGERMEELRHELFGKGKSHGGLYKDVLNMLDSFLYTRLIRVHDEEEPSTGQVHIYTGDGKGKTTMGVGLALRAKSRGLRVLYTQFMKNTHGGEAELLRKEGVHLRRFREVLSPLFNPDEDMDKLRMKAEEAIKVLGSMLEDYDVVVADEFVTMVARGLLKEDAALSFISGKPDGVELVLTGRGATEGLKEVADLVSEVKKVKHYADTGLYARKGIEY
jgi:cob(I)alamin adenosyltransferase